MQSRRGGTNRNGQAPAGVQVRSQHGAAQDVDDNQLEDQEVAAGSPNGAAMIAWSFRNKRQLYAWIRDDDRRQEAEGYVEEMEAQLRKLRGVNVRTQTFELLGKFLGAFGIEPGHKLWQRIAQLKRWMFLSEDELDDLAKTYRHQIIGSLYGIRNIGNVKAHTSSELTPDEQIEICGMVSTLSRVLPIVMPGIDGQVISPPPTPPTDSARLQPPALLMPMSRPAEEHRVAGSPPRALGMYQAEDEFPSLTAMPPLPRSSSQSSTASSSSSASSSQGVMSLRSVQTRRVAPMSRPAVESARAARSSPTTQPTVFFDPRIIKTFQMLFPRGRPIGPCNNAVTRFLVNRMEEHMNRVPKAKLCHPAGCIGDGCPRSHTYTECMSYNPLFKLIPCRDRDHYDKDRVEEYPGCPFIHVDVRVSNDWKNGQKRQFCAGRGDCRQGNCRRSHSAFEIKWFLPTFRNDECPRRENCHNRSRCTFYHNDDERRMEWVGANQTILFVERSHQALANALNALDQQNNA